MPTIRFQDGSMWKVEKDGYAACDQSGRAKGPLTPWRREAVELSDDLGARVARARAALHGEEVPEVVQRAAEVRRAIHGQQHDPAVERRLDEAMDALYGKGRRR
jgi:hypothetical protein